MKQTKDYFAFISYQRQDEEWASWLAHELEHYRLPISLNGRSDLPKDLRPIFRDVDELSAGNLPFQIYKALEASKNLIVVCSPHAAKSKWVNQEIEEFIGFGRKDKIFPFIIDGIAMSDNQENECFPPALRNLPQEDERLGGNITEKGRDAAIVKIVAGMLNLEFDSLWQRYEREKADEERKKQEERNRLLKVQSLYLSEKAEQLLDENDGHTARMLALEALPKNVNAPERPYVAAAERALRKVDKSSIGRVCIASSERIGSIALSPDSNFIVTTALAPIDSKRSDTIKVWNAANGRLIRTFVDCEEQETLVQFSFDGKLVATCALLWDHFDIRIWDFNSGTLRKILKGHKGSLSSLEFSKNGKWIISASNNDHTVRVWDVDTGIENCKIELVNDITPLEAHVHPDNIHIIITTERTIVQCEIETGNIINTIETNHWHAFSGTFLNQDGKIAAVLSSNNDESHKDNQFLALWSMESGTCLCKTEELSNSITDLFFPVNGKFFLTLSKDGTISAWDFLTGNLLQTIDLPITFSSGKFSNDGLMQWMLTSKGLFVNTLPKNKPVHKFRLDSWDNEEICSKDGSLVLSTSPYQINLYEVGTDKKLRTYDIKDSCVDISVLSASNKLTVVSQYNCYITVWDNETGNCIKTWQHPNPDDPINSIVFSPSEDQIITSSTDKVVRTWNVHTGELIQEFIGHKWPVLYADYSPDENKIVSASDDNSVIIWDAKAGTIIHSLYGHEDEVNQAVFSPDGKFIASASSDRTIVIWDAVNGTKLRTLVGHTYDVKSVEFNATSTQLVSVSGDETIKVWDVGTGIMIQSFNVSDFSSYHKPHAYFHDGYIVLPGKEIILYDYPSLETLISKMRHIYKDGVFSEEELIKYSLG